MTTPCLPFTLQICADLKEQWKGAVEQLLFFNPQQVLWVNQIRAAVKAYGNPRIHVVDHRLRITVGHNITVGTLFALVNSTEGEALAGILLFLRKATGLICLHISIGKIYSSRGHYAHLRVTNHLLDSLRSIGSRIVGVDHIEVFYNRMGWLKLPLSIHLV